MKKIRNMVVALTALGVLASPSMTATAADTPVTASPPTAATAAQETHRLSGPNRYGTAVAVSKHLYPAGADTVFVASGADFPDALAGGPGAAHQDAPVLLTKPKDVPQVVRDELARLAPQRIVVLGGTAAISQGTMNTLKGYAPTVQRVAGANRYGTAAELASLWDSAGTVYVASGRSYPDALAGGAAAAHHDAPVLLTNTRTLPADTASTLSRLKPAKVVVLGGTAAVSAGVVDKIRTTVPGATVTRYQGKNRYATAQEVAAKAWPGGSTEAFYATAAGFPDALSGVPAAAAHGAPMLLVRATCAPEPTQTATTQLGVLTEYLLGGTASIKNGATSTTCTTKPAAGTVLAVLEGIPVKGRAPKTGYDRNQFGPEWTDNVAVQGGHNGCDNRHDILRRDLTKKIFKPNTNGCVVQTGVLKDPFTGTNMPFERGETSHLIHIDHLVALSDAWQKGAQQISAEKRKEFANDPLNLWAVNGSQNMSKGDSDAATWLPPNKAIRCSYVAYQTAVKDKYNLWMTKAEKDAITRIVTTSCPNKKIPKSNNVPPLGQ